MPSSYTVAGFVFDNAGKAVSSAEISIFKAGATTNALSTTVTNASGFWSAASSSFSAVDGGFDVDVQITNAATGAVGRIKHADRIMTEAVFSRQIFLSPDSNDSTDANKGFFTLLKATSAQGENHTVTFPKLTGSPLVTATAQSSVGAITLSSLETITTAGDITLSSGTLTVGGNFTVSSAGVVTSTGSIAVTGASSFGSLHVAGGSTFTGAAIFNDNVTVNDTLTVVGPVFISPPTNDSLGARLVLESGDSIVAANDDIGTITWQTNDTGAVGDVAQIRVEAEQTYVTNDAPTRMSIFVNSDNAAPGNLTQISHFGPTSPHFRIFGNSTFSGTAAIAGTLIVGGLTTINDTLLVAGGSTLGAVMEFASEDTTVLANDNLVTLKFTTDDTDAGAGQIAEVRIEATQNFGSADSPVRMIFALNADGQGPGNLTTNITMEAAKMGVLGAAAVGQAANSTVVDNIRTALVNFGIMAP